MDEQKVLKLSDVVKMCHDFYSGEFSKEDLMAWGENLLIHPYLPIIDKMAILYDFFFSESFISSSIQVKIAEFECKKFWKILLKYTNIEIDDETLCNFDNYDDCFCALHDWVLNVCEKDYNRVCKMVSDNIILHSNTSLMNMIEEIDSSSMERNAKETERLLNELKTSSDTIDKLNNIAAFNHPSMVKVMDVMKDEAVKMAKK